tara:strand:- start:2367 stop:2963 length:597 start_codon:yes stop_codon:yes gene_type:complete
MDIKIKQEGKVKKFKLIKSLEDVTLEKWAKLIDFHSESKSNEALNTIAELSDIPEKLIKRLELSDVAVIMQKISDLQKGQNSSLTNIVTIDDVEYGFHPNLDNLTLGEYADIETFIKDGVNKNLPEVMAILYRPIVKKEKDVYTIEAYDGDITIRAEKMKKMNALQVQYALVFFWNFVNVLLMISELYLKEQIKKKIS